MFRNARQGEEFQDNISKDVAHNRWWQIFEVVCGVPFLVALVLHWVAPLPHLPEFLIPVLIPTGVMLLLVGGSLVVLARRELARHAQPTDPGHPTQKVVTTGVFSISRNPLYLGGIVMLAGVALACQLLWVLMLLIPSIMACQYWLIVPEERYLATTFGERYRLYTARVRRWIGRTHRSSSPMLSANISDEGGLFEKSSPASRKP